MSNFGGAVKNPGRNVVWYSPIPEKGPDKFDASFVRFSVIGQLIRFCKVESWTNKTIQTIYTAPTNKGKKTLKKVFWGHWWAGNRPVLPSDGRKDHCVVFESYQCQSLWWSIESVWVFETIKCWNICIYKPESIDPSIYIQKLVDKFNIHIKFEVYQSRLLVSRSGCSVELLLKMSNKLWSRINVEKLIKLFSRVNVEKVKQAVEYN